MEYVINNPSQLKPILVGYRKYKNMSQKEMAEKLNISQQAYQALEAKPHLASIERLMKVLNALGVKLYLSDKPLIANSSQKNTGTNVYSTEVIDTAKTDMQSPNNAPSNSIRKKVAKDRW
jgi:HTH-type transcriptional regulator/antitoxin HipB